jgi:hypothetical protein
MFGSYNSSIPMPSAPRNGRKIDSAKISSSLKTGWVISITQCQQDHWQGSQTLLRSLARRALIYPPPITDLSSLWTTRRTTIKRSKSPKTPRRYPKLSALTFRSRHAPTRSSARYTSSFRFCCESRENELPTLALPSEQHRKENQWDLDTSHCFTAISLPTGNQGEKSG